MHTGRIEIRVFEKIFSFDFDSIDETVVKHRDQSKIVLCDVTHCRTTSIEIFLTCSGKFLVDTVHETRRRERIVAAYRGELSSSEKTEMLVVIPFDVVAEEEDSLPLKPGKRKGRNCRHSSRKREGQGCRFFITDRFCSEGFAECREERRRSTGRIVRFPAIFFRNFEVDCESS